MDKSRRERTIQCSVGNKLKIRREFLVDFGRISLRRALDQVRRTFSRARFYDILPLRSYSAPKNSSISVFDGRRGALSVLSAAVVDFGIYRIWLGLFDRGSCIDNVDHVVLPLFSRRRRAHTNDWRRPGWSLHVSLYHLAATGLRTAHGRNRPLHRAGDRNVCDAQSRLVRTRREPSLKQKFVMARRVRFPARADEKEIKLRDLRNPRLKYFHERDEYQRGERLV